MTDREKLIELIRGTPDVKVWPDAGAKIADHLIANGLTVQKWIPVTERLPKVGEFVLFHYAKNNRNPTSHARNTMAVGRYEQKMFLVEGCAVTITHWMPLPKLPKEVET